jgi:hypothetical protein
MTANDEQDLHRRVAELENENARLRNTLESVKQERKELRKLLFAKAPPSREVSDEEYMDMLKNHVPGSGRKFMEELGIIPRANS